METSKDTGAGGIRIDAITSSLNASISKFVPRTGLHRNFLTGRTEVLFFLYLWYTKACWKMWFPGGFIIKMLSDIF
ncbi:MAG: hypothetical protein LBQ89_05195 [Treponema sp.]|jgi:hypothetical protein|nr:hypothetical protein [Treponema sp.]